MLESAEYRFFAELSGACTEARLAFAQRAGMSAPRLRVLMRLWRNGESGHSDLRRALSLDGATVTRLVKQFESDGLVTRRLDPADNRYTLTRLTPAGERAAGVLDQAHQAYLVQLLESVSAQERETSCPPCGGCAPT